MKKHIAYITVGLLLLTFSYFGYAQELVKLDIAPKQRQYLLLQQKALQHQLSMIIESASPNQAQIFEHISLLKRKFLENQRSYHILYQQVEMDESELAILKQRLDSPTTLQKDHYKKSYEETDSKLQTRRALLALYQENNLLIQKIEEQLEKKRLSLNKDKQQQAREEMASQNHRLSQSLLEEINQLLAKKITFADNQELEPHYKQTALELLSSEQNIKQLMLDYLNLKSKFDLQAERLPASASLSAINQHLSELKSFEGSFEKIAVLLDNNLAQLASLHKVIESLHPQDGVTTTEIKALLKNSSQLSAFIAENKRQLSDELSSLNASIKKIEHERLRKVSTRQTLLSYDSEELSHVFKGMVQLPIKFGLYIQSLFQTIEQSFGLLTVVEQISVIVVISLIFGLWLFGYPALKMKAHGDSASISKNLYLGIFRVAHRNFGSVCIFSSLLLIFYVCHISYGSARLVILLFITWFCFRGLLSVTRLVLFENESHVDGSDVALFYRLRIVFILGGVVTVLMLMSHELNLAQSSYFFSQLFMLFLFSVAIVLLRARDTLYVLLDSLLHVKRFYVKRALSMLLILSPLALMVNALVGLSGFLLIAWDVSYYLLVFVLGVSSYVIVRGVVNDLLDMVAKFLITYSKNGWFWGEAFLKPLGSLLNALLLIGLVLVLFFLFGLSKQERVLNLVVSLWHYQLFRYSKADITIGSFIEFSLLVMVFVWLTRWSRECCYRWVYRYIKDHGIRNSLSVFTQYAVVTFGFVITLRVLGVDISGVSMILGGLAVGMGFGLRDFANNIVGGLMLLIERPVKEGDLISIDNTEGRVIHIGIRSMRIRSWDHLEVLIPNSETFSKPFTNWTHQDSVVRTVITIKVSREDSATNVQKLILDVLDIIPEVLKDPEPQVYLKHIDEALLEFEVRYFINIEDNSRMNVRSIVLFAITAQFKAAGIKAPIPPISIDSLKPCR